MKKMYLLAGTGACVAARAGLWPTRQYFCFVLSTSVNLNHSVVPFVEGCVMYQYQAVVYVLLYILIVTSHRSILAMPTVKASAKVAALQAR